MIHQYESNGYNIVLDVNSGSIHVVDKLVYDILQKGGDLSFTDFWQKKDEITESLLDEGSLAGSGNPMEEIEEAFSEIRELAENGLLFTEDIYEEILADFSDASKPAGSPDSIGGSNKEYSGDLKKRETVVKALCLHIAHDCNLSCKYCFAGEGQYHGERGLMSYEVGKAALDFLIENSGNRVNLEVDFFGGEPLLNFDVVKRLVEYGRSRETPCNKKFRFTLTTNGVLLNREIMEFADKEMANVVLSIDGRREIHDKMRPFPNGAGSYDIIIPKFLEFAKFRGEKSYYVRGTYTHHNLDFSKDVLHLNDLGFDQISVEPVVAPENTDYAIKKEDLPKLFEEYDNLAKEMLNRKRKGKGFNFFHFMIDLEGGPCVAKRLSGCGSGTEYLAVTPWGDLYPCHQFTGMKEFLLGNVFEGIKRQDLCDEFKLCNVYAKEDCKSCFAKFYCSGGCAANSYHFKGNINDTYEIGCALQRKRVELSIMLKVAEGILTDFSDASKPEGCLDIKSRTAAESDK